MHGDKVAFSKAFPFALACCFLLSGCGSKQPVQSRNPITTTKTVNRTSGNPMNEDLFWKIIEDNNGNADRVTAALAKLSLEEIAAIQLMFVVP